MPVRMKIILPPSNIYLRAAVEAEAVAPFEGARFGVAVVPPGTSWFLVHLKSGSKVDSILPGSRKKITKADKLAVAAALEATPADWSLFDALPASTLETTAHPTFPRGAVTGPTIALLKKRAAEVIALRHGK